MSHAVADAPAGRMILGAHFTNDRQVAWRHPDCADATDIDAYIANAKAADEALFHFMFLAESLSLVEDKDGRPVHHQMNGRIEVVGIQSTIAGVTKQVGLVHTLNTTYNNPYEMTRELASLDVLSAGRVAWNVVTSQSRATVQNFRQGDYLPYADRYHRGGEFNDVLHAFWRGRPAGRVEYEGDFVSAHGTATWPEPGQVDGPIILQASSSETGARFGATIADAVYLMPRDMKNAQADYARLQSILRELGKPERSVKAIAGLRFVVGDTEKEAQEKFRHLSDLEFSDQDIISEIEDIWQVPLPDLDPSGRLPEFDADWDKLGAKLAGAPAQMSREPHEYVAQIRAIQESKDLTNRDLIVLLRSRFAIIGTPESIADEMERWFTSRACDGFIVANQLVPHGVIEFARRVVPVLQERGLFRDDAPEQTLREAWNAA